ncbi:hypothetical protein [Undibacterium sp. Ji49W]|uniref:hypothetical protein n=1 Tax=Undibacterium sp. Ji49W TaxID=3413040 RepID=UPI003BF1375C
MTTDITTGSPSGNVPEIKSIESEIKKIIATKDISELLDNSFVEYMLKKKVQQILLEFLKMLKYPLTVLVGLLIYFGIDAKKEFSKALESVKTLQDNIVTSEKQLKEQDELQKKLIDNLRQEIKMAKTESKDIAKDLEKELKTEVNDHKKFIEENHFKAIASATQLQMESEELKRLSKSSDDKLNKVQTSAIETQKIFESINAETVSLKGSLENQKRLLGASVVEFLTLNSNTQSVTLKLPKKDFGDYLVYFKTPGIKDAFELVYNVDGEDYSQRIAKEDKLTWHNIKGTNRQYQMRLDNLFSAPRAPDFVTIRIRSNDGLSANDSPPKIQEVANK